MTFNELCTQVLSLLPNATFGEMHNGQVVVYTHMIRQDDPEVWDGGDELVVEMP